MRRNSVERALRLAVVILLLTSGVVIDTSQAASWSQVNTGLPGAVVNVTSIAIAPAQHSTIYAHTLGVDGIGGIFKTTDGAGSWKTISSVVGVNFLVVDPQLQSTIYVVTGRGILKSTDGGDTWAAAGAGLPNTYIGILAIDPVSPSKLYAVVGNSIFKSADGAASWNVLNTGLPANSFISSLVVDPTNPSRIYAVAAIPNNGPSLPALLESTDEGGSWNLIASALFQTYSVTSLIASATAPSILYAISPSGPSGTSILKSADAGRTWTQVNTGLPPGAGVSSLVLDPTDSSTIYLAVDFFQAEAGGILKSGDGGATWKAIKPDLPANSPIDYLAIDPVSPSTLYTITGGTLLKSTDAGINWTASTTGLTAIAASALAVNPLDASTVYTGAGNGLFKSVDRGATWNQLFAFQLFSTGTELIGSFFPDGSPAYPQSLLIDFVNPDILYVATGRGNGCYYADNLLFKSTDGGMNWDNSVSPDKSGCVFGGIFAQSAGLKAMDPTDPNTLYLAEADDGDGYWALLKSQDGGTTWNSLGDFPNDLQAGVWTLAIDPTTPTTLYAGLDDVPMYSNTGDTVIPGTGGVFKSTDGGTSWNSIGLSGVAVNLLALDPMQPSVLYAVTEGDYGTPRGFRGLSKSTDGGTTWSAINQGLEGLLALGTTVSAIVIDPADSNTLYLGAAGGGVFQSSDGGVSWRAINDGLTNLDVRVLAVAPGSGHTLYVGTSGGVFRMDGVQ
jgi:photosystem II stability/assembly factor-like uncharacterized protein